MRDAEVGKRYLHLRSLRIDYRNAEFAPTRTSNTGSVHVPQTMHEVGIASCHYEERLWFPKQHFAVRAKERIDVDVCAHIPSQRHFSECNCQASV